MFDRLFIFILGVGGGYLAFKYPEKAEMVRGAAASFVGEITNIIF